MKIDDSDLVRDPLTCGLQYTREAYDAHVERLWEQCALTMYSTGVSERYAFEQADQFIKEYQRRRPRP